MKMDKEIELDMHRMYMEREDKMSLEYNNYLHRMKFKEKDMSVPELPYCLRDPSEPFKNIPVQKTLHPTYP